jgi:hypothetical protein
MKRKLMVMAFALVAAAAAVSLGASGAQAQSPGVIASTGGPYSGVPGAGIQFNAGGSAGFQLTYFWNFGDGTVGSGIAPVKAYAAPGTYTVALTVRDAFGFQSTQYTNAFVSGVVAVPNLVASCINTPDGLRVCDNGVVAPYGVGALVVGNNRIIAPVAAPVQLGSVGACNIYGGSCVVATTPYGVTSVYGTTVYANPFGCTTMLINGVTVCR